MEKQNFRSIITKVLAVLTSGFCWYLANSLTGGFWYLMWIAPVPVLLSSYRSSARDAFFISFMAYLIGRLSWFSYLVTVATLVPAIVFTILLSLIFAVIVLLSRATVIRMPDLASVFAFPVYFTTFEFLLYKFSPDGTAASIAYSQADFLWIIQIASITGVAGITFLLTLFPSAVVLSWMNVTHKKNLAFITIFTSAVFILVLAFGMWRTGFPLKVRSVTAGLIVLDESHHTVSRNFDPQKELQTVKLYAEEIDTLAQDGADLIVLPERAFNMNKASQQELTDILINAAKENNVVIIAGYTNYTGENDRNSAIIISPNGDILADYNKNHLVTGLENQFVPGNSPAFVESAQLSLGVAICKDLDFPDFIRDYGKAGVSLLGIPAWDFVVDSWLHSRMAVLRGVEDGFSEVRAARQGFLTISDCCGRVTSQADCSNGQRASLTGSVELRKEETFFSIYGNWFGYLNILTAIYLITILFFKKANKAFRNDFKR